MGAIACWDNYDGDKGHVAVVESISGNSVLISESHYQSVNFDTRTINADSSNYLTSKRFLGYIYIGLFEEPTSYAPQGSVDGIVGGTGCVTVSGWAFDKDDTSRALPVHVYAGGPAGSGTMIGEIIADEERPDVGNAYGVGNFHGFYDTIETDLSGSQTLYFYAIGAGDGGNALIGTKEVTIRRRPVGSIDLAEGGLRRIRVSGWAFDPEDLTRSVQVHAYIGGPAGSGAPGYSFMADEYRPDVNAGGNYGFDKTVETDLSGSQEVYLYAMDAAGQNFSLIGTRTVSVTAGESPVGVLDQAVGGTDSVSVCGWAYDPDDESRTAYIHVYAGGPAGSGTMLCEIAADKERPDLGAGSRHGFEEQIPVSFSGTKTLYFYAIDTNGNMHALIGTETVTVRQGKSPVGVLDSVQGKEGSVSVSGWAVDEDDPAGAVPIHVYVGGPAGSGAPMYEIMADEERADLSGAFQGAGTKHGFSETITTGKRGRQEIYVYAIDRASYRDNLLLGSVSVTIQDPQSAQEHTHQYRAATTRAATCAREGEIKYVCSCGSSYTERIEKTPHTAVADAAVPATCTEAGKTAGSHCSACGTVLKAQAIVEKTGHRHTETRNAREATCMSAGYMGDTYCVDCGRKIREGAETEKLAHDWDNGVTEKEPTETEDGILVYTCKNCQTTRNKKIPATGPADPEPDEPHAHRYEEETVREATCARGGEKKFTCSCGASYTEATDALGHDWDDGAVLEEPTETEAGTKVFTCERCGSTREIVLPATGKEEPHVHQYEAETVKFATCKKEGLKRYTCSCGDSYTETTSPLGHDWDGGTVTKEPTETETGIKVFACTRCDSTRETVIPKTGENDPDAEEPHVHQYEEEMVKEATCTRNGEKKYTCACGDSYTETVERLGHDWDEGVVEEEATETEDGLMLYTCRRCDSTRETVIPKTGTDGPDDPDDPDNPDDPDDPDNPDNPDDPHEHAYEETGRTEATCTEDGEIRYECPCGDSCEEEIPAAGHRWDAGTVTEKATETETGVKTYTCAVCGATREETLPKINPQQEEDDDWLLNEGDVVYDEQRTAEYEVVWVRGGETGVEYAEPMKKKASSVKIPDVIETEEGVECKVVSIAPGAFRNNKKVKKVSIGKNVSVIGSRAFSGCKNLTGLTLGKNVEEIGSNAFSGCAKLKTLTLPEKAAKIGANAFYGCKKLATLTVKSRKLSSKGISKKAFKGMPEKARVKVPNGKAKQYKRLFRQKGLSAKIKVS